MSRILELPDAVYAALEREAAARGLDPVAWIAAHLPVQAGMSANAENGKPRTMLDLFAGHIGVIASGIGDLSEDTGRKFAEGMEQKRREGRL
jgi:hypothetical protein